MKLHLVILQKIITLNPHDIAIAMPVRHNCVTVDSKVKSIGSLSNKDGDGYENVT